MIVNLMWGLIPALFAVGLGLDPWVVVAVWWVAFRAECFFDVIAVIGRLTRERGEIEARVAMHRGEL